MRCFKCNTMNISDANFCYNCGEKIRKKKINFSFKSFTNKYLIFSKNKYRNIFILLSIFILSSALSVPLFQGLPESFCIAMDLVNMSNSKEIAKYVLKSQTELYFRDVFFRIILLTLFLCLLLFDIIILVYSFALKKQINKNKY